MLLRSEERRGVELRRQRDTFMDYCSSLSFEDPTMINKSDVTV